jgi:dCTP deaminase
MILSDIDIKSAVESKKIEVEPWEPMNVGPSTLDLRLSNKIQSIDGAYYIGSGYDPTSNLKNHLNEVLYGESSFDDKIGSFTLKPGNSCLACLMEKVKMKYFRGLIVNRSNMSKLLDIPESYVDPGYSGYLNIRITNSNNFPVVLREGLRVVQMEFYPVKPKVDYQKRKISKNNDQTEPGCFPFKIDKEWR